MTEFQLAYQKTMNHEGSYSNDPRDRGGETYCGVSRRNWPLWQGWSMIDFMKNLTDNKEDFSRALENSTELSEMVERFYKDNFWNRLSLDDFDNQEIKTEIFEQAVNLGVFVASKNLQTALSLLDFNGGKGLKLKIDGKIGPITLSTYRKYMSTADKPGRSVQRNTRTLIKVLNALQFDHYKACCEADPSQINFLYGWLNRV